MYTSLSSYHSDTFHLLSRDDVKCLTFIPLYIPHLFFGLLHHLEIPGHNLTNMNIYEDHCFFIILMRRIPRLYVPLMLNSIFGIFQKNDLSLKKTLLYGRKYTSTPDLTGYSLIILNALFNNKSDLHVNIN